MTKHKQNWLPSTWPIFLLCQGPGEGMGSWVISKIAGIHCSIFLLDHVLIFLKSMSNTIVVSGAKDWAIWCNVCIHQYSPIPCSFAEFIRMIFTHPGRSNPFQSMYIYVMYWSVDQVKYTPPNQKISVDCRSLINDVQSDRVAYLLSNFWFKHPFTLIAHPTSTLSWFQHVGFQWQFSSLPSNWPCQPMVIIWKRVRDCWILGITNRVSITVPSGYLT